MPAEVESMAYVGSRGLPWHGLGTAVPDLMTAADAIAPGGLDWKVESRPLMVANGETSFVVPDKVANVRASDGKYLGTVGKKYRVIQNDEGLDMLDSLVASADAKYETVGSLRGGAVTFISAEMNHLNLRINGDTLGGGDVRTYLLLSNAHDGSRALDIAITPVRVVCMNTLNLALGRKEAHFRIRHSGSVEGKMQAARDALGITVDYMARFEAVAADLMSRTIVDDEIDEIMRSVWPMKDDLPDGRIDNHPATRALETYFDSETLGDIRGTAWGVLNAVAEFVDHENAYRSRVNDVADVRAEAILWGRGQDAKQRALAVLTGAR